MKALGATVVICVLKFSSVLWAQGVSKGSLDLSPARAAKFRCAIQQKSTGMWDLKVLAIDASHRIIFDYLYSVRPNIKKSMDDCSAWLKAVKKKKKAAVESQSGVRVRQK